MSWCFIIDINFNGDLFVKLKIILLADTITKLQTSRVDDLKDWNGVKMQQGKLGRCLVSGLLGEETS